MKFYLFSVLYLFASLAASAQITLTPANSPVVGDTNIYGVDTVLYPGFNSGQFGANKTYDYSNLAINLYDTVRYLDPAQTPFGINYPTATIARYDLDDTSIIYWKADTSQIVDLGFVSDTYNTNNFIQYHYTGYKINLTFPSTYNTYHPNNVSVYDLTVPGSYANQPYDSIRRKLTDNRTIIFDGWGTLILASGSYPCLRESRQDSYIDSVWSKNNGGNWILIKHNTKALNTIRYFTNISNDPMMRIKYDDNLQPKAAYFLINPVLFTGTKEKSVQLTSKVFPSPATNELFLLHNATGKNKLIIYDVSGKIVYDKWMVNTVHQLSCENFSSGTYFYQVVNLKGILVLKDKFMVLH